MVNETATWRYQPPGQGKLHASS